MLLIGKPSISISHLYHGYVTVITILGTHFFEGYPLVNIQKATVLKIAIEIVDFPIKNGDFPWLC